MELIVYKGFCWFAKNEYKAILVGVVCSSWPGEQKNDHFSLHGWSILLFLVPTGCCFLNEDY